MTELTIRPAPIAAPTTLDSVFKVYLSVEYLLRHNLQAGYVCLLRRDAVVLGSVVIEKSPDSNIKSSVVQTSKSLQSLYQLKLSDKVSLHRRQGELPHAMQITVLQYFKEEDGRERTIPMHAEEKAPCSWILKQLCLQAKMVSPAFRLEGKDVFGQLYLENQSFKISKVNASEEMQPYLMTPDTSVSIVDADESVEPQVRLKVPRSAVGGLEHPLEQLIWSCQHTKHQTEVSSGLTAPNLDEIPGFYSMAYLVLVKVCF